MVKFFKNKSYPPPHIFALHLCMETYSATFKAVLGRSLLPLQGERLKCSAIMERYRVGWPSSRRPTGNFSWNWTEQQQRLKSTVNVKAESEKKVREGRNFQYQPVLWPLSGQVPATSQKDQVSGGGGVAEACVQTHREGKRVSYSCSTSKS